jgi:hypothetical protein
MPAAAAAATATPPTAAAPAAAAAPALALLAAATAALALALAGRARREASEARLQPKVSKVSRKPCLSFWVWGGQHRGQRDAARGTSSTYLLTCSRNIATAWNSCAIASASSPPRCRAFT